MANSPPRRIIDTRNYLRSFGHVHQTMAIKIRTAMMASRNSKNMASPFMETGEEKRF